MCDDKIRAWLFERNKFSVQKRKRGVWITKLGAQQRNVNGNRTPTSNTPKRSTNVLRRTRSAGVIDDADVFSPVVKSMFKTPVVVNKVHVRKSVSKSVRVNQVGLLFCLCVCICYCLLLFVVLHNLAGSLEST